MFIDDTKIDIKVYFKKIRSRYEAFSNNEFSKLKLKDEERKKYSVLNIKVIELTWGLQNQLQDSAFDDVGEERKWNFRKFKENKIKMIVKEWDAKDDKGNVVPVNELNLLKLAPSIAEAILRSYDEISFLTEEEEKNL